MLLVRAAKAYESAVNREVVKRSAGFKTFGSK
jgi:hypothetical protein